MTRSRVALRKLLPQPALPQLLLSPVSGPSGSQVAHRITASRRRADDRAIGDSFLERVAFRPPATCTQHGTSVSAPTFAIDSTSIVINPPPASQAQEVAVVQSKLCRRMPSLHGCFLRFLMWPIRACPEAA